MTPFGAPSDPGDRLGGTGATPGPSGRRGGLHEEHIERAVLPNGAVVLSRYLPDPDIVAISIGSRAGARFETDQTAAVTKLLENLYLQGTTRRPGPELVQRPLTIRGGGISTLA